MENIFHCLAGFSFSGFQINRFAKPASQTCCHKGDRVWCHSVNRCVMHDGWHFYLTKYGCQCSTLVISSDAELQNRKSQVPPTMTGYLTQKHYNFELSIITIALAPLTCLWPTKDARMAFSFLQDHDQSLMVLSLVFKTKVEGYRKARGEYKAYAYMTSPACMIRESKSINEVYRSPICIEP